jgi:hypothetical protein
MFRIEWLRIEEEKEYSDRECEEELVVYIRLRSRVGMREVERGLGWVRE